VSEEGNSEVDNAFWAKYTVLVAQDMLSHNIYEMLEGNTWRDKRHELSTAYMEDTCMVLNVEELMDKTL